LEKTARDKMLPIAMIGLCVVIGVMTLVAVVYYTNASNSQTQNNTQVATLQSMINQLQADKTQLQNQINSRDAQITDSNARMNDLLTQNQDLSYRLDLLMGLANEISFPLTSPLYPFNGGTGAHPQ
jgi:uncharacterized protein YlxW (UPF0749 family)